MDAITLSKVADILNKKVAPLDASSKVPTANLPVVPVANGGTGSATQNFVDLTTAQTIGGAKTFTAPMMTKNNTLDDGAGVILANRLVTKNAGTAQYVHQSYQHNGMERWKWITESNANLSLYDYDVSGATPRNTLQIYKDSGLVDFAAGYANGGIVQPQLRVSGGQLQYYDGGVWKSVGGYGSGKYVGSFSTSSTTMVTALSVTGTGRLISLVKTVSNSANVTVKVDGVTIISDTDLSLYGITATGGAPSPTYPTPVNIDVSFASSVEIQMRAPTGALTTAKWAYELL